MLVQQKTEKTLCCEVLALIKRILLSDGRFVSIKRPNIFFPNKLKSIADLDRRHKGKVCPAVSRGGGEVVEGGLNRRPITYEWRRYEQGQTITQVPTHKGK